MRNAIWVIATTGLLCISCAPRDFNKDGTVENVTTVPKFDLRKAKITVWTKVTFPSGTSEVVIANNEFGHCDMVRSSNQKIGFIKVDTVYKIDPTGVSTRIGEGYQDAIFGAEKSKFKTIIVTLKLLENGKAAAEKLECHVSSNGKNIDNSLINKILQRNLKEIFQDTRYVSL